MAVLNVPEAIQTTTYPSLAQNWRNKMRSTSPSSPIERDQDQKLLLWAEYAETFSHCRFPRDAMPSDYHSPGFMTVQAAMKDQTFDLESPEARPPTSGSKITSPSLASITEQTTSEEEKPRYNFEKRRDFLAQWDSWRNQWEASGGKSLGITERCGC
jgi:hypothetical protein